MLQRIDPWDDVTLTSSEMPQFLDELDYLRTLAEDDVERDALDELVAIPLGRGPLHDVELFPGGRRPGGVIPGFRVDLESTLG